jgi:hypothetical protein
MTDATNYKTLRGDWVAATRYHREEDPEAAPLRAAGYSRSDWTEGFCWAHPASGQDIDFPSPGFGLHQPDTHWLIASERDGYGGTLTSDSVRDSLNLARCYAMRVTLDENGQAATTVLGHMLTVPEAMQAITLDMRRVL